MFLIYYGDGNGIWNLLVIFSTSRWLTWSWPSSNPVPVPVIIYWLTILNRKPSYPTAMSHWKTLPCRVMKIGWWCLVTNPSISGTKDPGCLNPSWTPARWQRFRCLVDPFADRWETSFKIIHTQATGWVVEMHENAGEFFFYKWKISEESSNRLFVCGLPKMDWIHDDPWNMWWTEQKLGWHGKHQICVGDCCKLKSWMVGAPLFDWCLITIMWLKQ